MSIEFAERLRHTMGDMSQRELANRAGVDHSTISRLLSGKRDATAPVAEALVKVFPDKTKKEKQEFVLSAVGHSADFINNVIDRKPNTRTRWA